MLQQNVTNFVFAATGKKKVKPASNETVIPKAKLSVRVAVHFAINFRCNPIRENLPCLNSTRPQELCALSYDEQFAENLYNFIAASGRRGDTPASQAAPGTAVFHSLVAALGIICKAPLRDRSIALFQLFSNDGETVDEVRPRVTRFSIYAFSAFPRSIFFCFSSSRA